jgi:hypothetical protein
MLFCRICHMTIGAIQANEFTSFPVEQHFETTAAVQASCTRPLMLRSVLQA